MSIPSTYGWMSNENYALMTRALLFFTLMSWLCAEVLAIMIAYRGSHLRPIHNSVASVLPYCTPLPLILAHQAYSCTKKYWQANLQCQAVLNEIWFWFALSLGTGYGVLGAALLSVLERMG